jgi:Methyltransferase domain
MSKPQPPMANSPYEVHRAVLPLVLNERNLLGEGAEVGVRQGDFSAHILKHWKGSKLWLIDAWQDLPGYEEVHHTHEQNYEMTLGKMRAFPGRHEVIRDLSTAAAARFADETLDFVYLDADHSYESVKADLDAWYPKLKPGGLFAGDDYGALPLQMVNFGAGHLTFGVKKAVDEFAFRRQKNISIDWLGDWWFESTVGTIRARNWYLIK